MPSSWPFSASIFITTKWFSNAEVPVFLSGLQDHASLPVTYPHPPSDFFLLLDASGMKPAVLWKRCAVLLQAFRPALLCLRHLPLPPSPPPYPPPPTPSSGFSLNTIFFKKFFLGLGAFSSVPAAAPSSWHLSHPMLIAFHFSYCPGNPGRQGLPFSPVFGPNDRESACSAGDPGSIPGREDPL